MIPRVFAVSSEDDPMFTQFQHFIPVYNLHFISGKLKHLYKVKMLIYFIAIVALSLHKAVTIDIMPI